MTVAALKFDPNLVATVERALEPYKQRGYPLEMIEHFRQEALIQLSLYPYTAALVEQLKPEPEANASGSGPQPTEAGALALGQPGADGRRVNGASGRGGGR